MSIPSWVRVGAKVVCIDNAPRNFSTCNLVQNAVYTVVGSSFAPDGGFGLYLNEVQSAVVWQNDGRRAGYCVDRFRPVHTLRSDVAAIKSMLLPADELV